MKFLNVCDTCALVAVAFGANIGSSSLTPLNIPASDSRLIASCAHHSASEKSLYSGISRYLGILDMDNTKTEAGSRTMSIPSTLADLLKEYKSWKDEEKSKWGDKWVDSGKLFTKENREPIFPDTPSRWFAVALVRQIYQTKSSPAADLSPATTYKRFASNFSGG